MNHFSKPFFYSIVAGSLILSASAWSKTGCAVSTAGFVQTKIDHLGVQIQKTNSDIQKLQSVLMMTKADIATLRNQEMGQASLIVSANKPNGRGIPVRYRTGR